MSFILKESFRRIPLWIFALIIFLLGARMVLPILGLHVVNWALDKKMGHYTGSIDDFDLSLYRGAYQLQGLVIRKREVVEKPLISCSQIDLSLAWRALLRGEISADVTLDEFILRLVKSDSSAKKQLGTEQKTSDWRKTLNVLVPMHIESFIAKNSAIYLNQIDISGVPPVRIEKMELKASDLRNRHQPKDQAISPFLLQATVQGHATLWASGNLDILATPFRADADFKLLRFQVSSLNDILRMDIPMDFTKGILDVYGELATARGELKGYGKFFLADAQIIARDQKFQSVKHFAYELMAALGNWILKNNKTQKVAARVAFERQNGKFNIDGSEAFWSTVKNMQDQMDTGIENSISLKNLAARKDVP